MMTSASCQLSKGRIERSNFHVLTKLTDYDSSSSFLNETPIPIRTGGRPQCEECLPHAQMTQQSPDEVFEEFKTKALELLGNSVTIGKSTVSMPSTFPAFHLKCDGGCMMPHEACMTPGGPTRGTEFAHVHTRYFPDDSDFARSNKERRFQEWQGGGQGSMHLCLTLKDAAVVLEKGWAERHLLAGDDSISFSVPRGLVLVYAPRNQEETKVCLQILRAALLFAQMAS